MSRESAVRAERMVLLYATRQEVPEWVEAEPGSGQGLLESNWSRQTGIAQREQPDSWYKEGIGILLRESTERDED